MSCKSTFSTITSDSGDSDVAVDTESDVTTAGGAKLSTTTSGVAAGVGIDSGATSCSVVTTSDTVVVTAADTVVGDSGDVTA